MARSWWTVVGDVNTCRCRQKDGQDDKAGELQDQESLTYYP
jgi:hypothetical protein